MDIWSVIKLVGGLGLFLYGMKLMAESLEKAAGNKLRRGLEILTTNRVIGALLGIGVTFVIQSSSATTVMVVGFVNAGLMTLMQAAGVMMGANVGTTITAWIVGIKMTDLAPLFVFIGIVMMFLKKRSVKRIGGIILGFGVIFVGMEMMTEAMAPLKEMESFQSLLVSFRHPLIGILVGLLVTMLIQSSSATTGMLVGLALAGAITLDSAVYVILGTNMGTCITAILSSIGASKTARRAALFHLFFNVFGVIVFTILLQALPIVSWIQGITSEVQVQIALFHTIFNTVTLLLLIGYPQPIIKLTGLIIRGEDEMVKRRRFQYIGEKLLETPSIAVSQTIKEVTRMAEIAKENYELSMQAFLGPDESKIPVVLEQEQLVNYLNHEITSFLAKVTAQELSEGDASIAADLFHIINDIERISDHAENFTEYAESRFDNNIPFTEDALAELREMHSYVSQAVEKCVVAFEKSDKKLADEVIRIEKIVDKYEGDLKNNHVTRISSGKCTARAGMIFTDLVTNLERVADHATNIAYYVSQSNFR
jgi:phosphate:Na+ symporter